MDADTAQSVYCSPSPRGYTALGPYITQGYARCVRLEPAVDRYNLWRMVQKSHDRDRFRSLQRCQRDSDPRTNHPDAYSAAHD